MRHSSAAICFSLLFLSTGMLTLSCAPDLKVGTGGSAGATSSSSSSGDIGGAGGMGGASSSSSSASSSSSSSSGGMLGELGAACLDDAGCASGHCADGVCCNETCNATCMKCNQMGKVGTCSPLPVGGDDCDVEGELCNPAQQCVCGISPAPTGTMCPAPWVDGPKPGSCLMQCDTMNACSSGINCPPGFDCHVECSGEGSCSGIDAGVECPEDYACSVTCSGVGSCQTDFRVRCSEKGPCVLNCGSASEACKGSRLRCGSNACTAICNGTNTPTLENTSSTCTATGC